MTNNQLKSQELSVKREELEEKKRTGKAERFGKYAKGGADVIKSIIGVANDPSWYNLDKQLVDDVAQISFGKPLGVAEKLNAERKGISRDDLKERTPASVSAFPGVGILNFTPVVGANKSQSSAINVAARNIYAFVRHANSGHSNYDAPDLMQYLLSLDSVYYFIMHCARAYSVALTAKSENRYYPEGVLKALGFKTRGDDSIVNNLAQFRAMINQYIQKANIFNVPAKFPYYARHMWMTANIFKDSDYKRSRLYVFKPNGVYLAPNDKGTMIFAHSWTGVKQDDGSTKWTVSSRKDLTGVANVFDFDGELNMDDLRVIFETLIDPITNNEDFGIMSGDILKAYGDGGLFVINQIPEDYHIEAIYSPEVLTQLTGANVAFGDYEGAQICQDSTDNVLYQGTYGIVKAGIHTPQATPGIYLQDTFSQNTKAAATSENTRNVINHYKDEVSPDDNMVATRLMHTSVCEGRGYEDYTTFGVKLQKKLVIHRVVTCGTELITRFDVVFLQRDPDTKEEKYRTILWHGVTDLAYTEASNYNDAYIMIKELSLFDWAPIIRVYLSASKLEDGYDNNFLIYDTMEIENYAIIDEEVLDKMHAVATLSLFAVPITSKTARKY